MLFLSNEAVVTIQSKHYRSLTQALTERISCTHHKFREQNQTLGSPVEVPFGAEPFLHIARLTARLTGPRRIKTKAQCRAASNLAL